jgi:UDP:flavonoid glycosyltransferase YjiC (YdhE family)
MYSDERPRPAAFVVDFFTTAARDAADFLNVPAVVVFPNPLSMLSLRDPSQRGWAERLKAVGGNAAEAVLARVLCLLRNRERSARGLARLPEQDIYPALESTRPFVVTTGFGYEYPHSASPLVHFVGPCAPPRYPPLSAELSAWIDAQSLPLLYIAFGSEHTFTPTSIAPLLSAVDALLNKHCAVLWSLAQAQHALLPAELTCRQGLRVDSWLPQFAVLHHPSTAAFVSHCGANSTSEALLAAVPIVCCPGYADQPANAARIVSAGVGVRPSGGGVGPGLLEAVITVLGDATYRERSVTLRERLLSQGGAARAADAIEVISTVGCDHLQPRRKRASWLLGLLG